MKIGICPRGIVIEDFDCADTQECPISYTQCVLMLQRPENGSLFVAQQWLDQKDRDNAS